MGIATFPAPSAGGATAFPSAGALVASSFETKGYYSTTLAAGRYIVTAIGAQSNQGWPTNNNDHKKSTFSVTSYANNVYQRNAQYGQPMVINLTTTDTVYITSATQHNSPWSYSFSGTNESYRIRERWDSANSDIDKFFWCGYNNADMYVSNKLYWVPPTIPSPYNSNTDGRIAIYNVGSTSYRSQNACNYAAYLNDAWFFARGHYVNPSTRTITLFRSTDFVTWGAVTTNTTASEPIQGMIYANGKYLVCSRDVTNTSNVAWSTDGITWTATNSNMTGSYPQHFAYGNGVYVLVGTSGRISSSTDGITWAARTAPTTSTNYYRVLFANNLFLALGDSTGSSYTAMAVSTDGTTWTAASGFANIAAANAYAAEPTKAFNYALGIGETEGGQVFTADNEFWVIKGDNIWTSTNGTAWTVRHQGLGIAQAAQIAGYSSTWGRVIGWHYNDAGEFNTIDYGSPANYLIYESSL